MRVLVCALSVAAIVGSASAVATKSPFRDANASADQIADATFVLASLDVVDDAKLTRGIAEATSPALDPGVLAKQFPKMTLALASADHTPDLLLDQDLLSSFAETIEFFVPEQVLRGSLDDEDWPAFDASTVATPRSPEQGFAWDDLDQLPSPAVLAGLAVPQRRFLVGDEDGEPEVDHTASTQIISDAQLADMALDGYEDR